MNLFKHNLVELYAKAETGTLYYDQEILPDPLTSPAEQIEKLVTRLNDKDETLYWLGKTRLTDGTEGEADRNVNLLATDHFFYRFLHQRVMKGGKEYILKPAEIDMKYRGDRSLENIRNRETLKKMLTKTAQKLANFYINSRDSFTPYSVEIQQGMGCKIVWDGDQMELEFSTFLPHKANKPTSKFYSIFLPIDDPMNP